MKIQFVRLIAIALASTSFSVVALPDLDDMKSQGQGKAAEMQTQSDDKKAEIKEHRDAMKAKGDDKKAEMKEHRDAMKAKGDDKKAEMKEQRDDMKSKKSELSEKSPSRNQGNRFPQKLNKQRLT
ncbi:MAG: hypothetical protein ACPGYX_03875 [Oceanobacter sp.]